MNRPPRPPSLGRTNKFGSREGMLVPPTYLPAASFRPPAYPILGSPTSIYYGMVPTLPAMGQMSPTGGGATGGSGTAGYQAAVGGIPNINQGVIVPVPSLSVASTMGGPHSLDSLTAGSVHQQVAQNILYMQPLQHQHLQTQVSLSGSPIQQHEFTQPSSPVGFKAPPTIAAMAGEGGGGGVARSEESGGTLMGSIQQQQQQQQQAHLVQTQGLVTMTPIMAASASPSSSLNLSHGMHHLHQQQHHHQLTSHQLQAQLQQQAATSAPPGGAAGIGGGAGGGGVSGIIEHMQQAQAAAARAIATTLPQISGLYQEGQQHGVPPPHPGTQQQALLAQFHHQAMIAASTGTPAGGPGPPTGGAEGAIAVGTSTGTGSTNLPLMPPPMQQLPVGGAGGVVMIGGTRNESEPLLPNPPIPPLQPAKHVTSVAAGGVGGGAGGGASSSGHHGGSGNQRKEIPCKHFIAGTCPFGEKCWFAHLEPATLHQQREARVSSQQPSSASSATPLQVQIPPNLWLNNPNMLFDLSRFTVASPPQSPLNSTLMSGTRPPILPTLVRPRAYYPNFPGQQPLLLVRPPGGTAMFPAGVQGVGMGLGGGGVGGGGFPYFAHTGQYPSLQTQVNPILKFNLLSEVVIKQQVDNQEIVVANITKMITRADHFYVTYGQLIHDYKILFGGNRSFHESSVLIERKVIAEAVSCLHFSKQQPTLMIIGTVFGSIYTWDVRKGAAGGVVTSAHKAEVCCHMRLVIKLFCIFPVTAWYMYVE